MEPANQTKVAKPTRSGVTFGSNPVAAIAPIRSGLLAGAAVMDLAAQTANIPAGLPATLLPLYKIIRSFVLKKHGYDIAKITTNIVLGLGAVAGFHVIWSYVKPTTGNILTCSVTIPAEHEAATLVQEWMSKNAKGTAARHVTLQESRSSRIDDNNTDDITKAFNTRTAINSAWFWYDGFPIHFRSINKDRAKSSLEKTEEIVKTAIADRLSNGDDSGPGADNGKDHVILTTFRFTASAIAKFLKAIEKSNDESVGKVIVHTMSVDHGYHYWKGKQQAARPIDTVDLDPELKADLMKDVTTYFHADRAQWYSQRGIPYRRGLLFHGCPGTGKSSVSMALAGHFKSDLYVLNLSEVKGESALKSLFEKPKRGDVVLLEDIDCAGIARDTMVKDKYTGEMRERNSNDKGVTLSGLINVIDGVGGRADGVLLIMTTNDPESLDKALVRNGRIDKQFLLGNAGLSVAKDIFERMYQDDKATLEMGTRQVAPDIAELAKQFSAKIPDNKITPAEIQGHLIGIECPKQAVQTADSWIADLLAAKEAGRNIVGAEFDHLGKMKKDSPALNNDVSTPREENSHFGGQGESQIPDQTELPEHNAQNDKDEDSAELQDRNDSAVDLEKLKKTSVNSNSSSENIREMYPDVVREVIASEEDSIPQPP